MPNLWSSFPSLILNKCKDSKTPLATFSGETWGYVYCMFKNKKWGFLNLSWSLFGMIMMETRVQIPLESLRCGLLQFHFSFFWLLSTTTNWWMPNCMKHITSHIVFHHFWTPQVLHREKQQLPLTSNRLHSRNLDIHRVTTWTQVNPFYRYKIEAQITRLESVWPKFSPWLGFESPWALPLTKGRCQHSWGAIHLPWKQTSKANQMNRNLKVTISPCWLQRESWVTGSYIDSDTAHI